MSAAAQAVTDFGRAALEYAASVVSDKRRAPSGRIFREEAMLTQQKRRVVTSSIRDLARNLSILAWAVRKHLDYNTQFNLQSQTGDEEFDQEFEKFFDEISSADECDVSGRHCFESLLRMIEQSALLEGDVGVLKLASGHIQGIESDLIQDPEDRGSNEVWFNGVQINAANRPVSYGVFARGDGGKGYKFNRRVTAANMYLHGYFTRFDQCRGVSPLTSAVNDFQDIYEGKELALAKLKVQQFFAIAFSRDAAESPGEIDDSEAVDEEGNEVNRGGYKVNFGKGPAMLDLDDGDKVEFLEGSNPSTSTQDFLMLVCQIALKALDLPFSFFNESFTNFFGSRAAWLHYERSCVEKRNNLIRFANDWLRWRVQLAIKSGRLKVPTDVLDAAGPGLARVWWEFVPVGMPWWDPGKEIDGDVKAIQEGLSSRQRVCRQRGTDFYENIRQRAREEAFAEKHGVKLGSQVPPPAPGGIPGKTPPDDEKPDDENEDDTETEDDGSNDAGDDGGDDEGSGTARHSRLDRPKRLDRGRDCVV